MTLRPILLAACALAFAACAAPADDGTPDAGRRVDAGSGDPGGGPAKLGGLNCDPLVPTQCGFPWPSDVFLVDDATTASGKRVAFGPATLPKYFNHDHMDRAPFEDADGWSPGTALVTHLPGATITGLADPDTIEASLAAGSPTIVIEADTGARVPHWAELDSTTKNNADRAFLIRPVVRLKDKTRYIVAIRHVKDATGADLAPTALFQAFRDGTGSTDPSYAPREALYADIFAKLTAAGVAKADLQLAWDFTTASRESLTRNMLSVRDQALKIVGDQGPEYRNLQVTNAPNAHIWKRIRGEMKVPLFLNKPGAHEGENDATGVHMLFDAAGKPKQNPDEPWAWYRFQIQVPNSAKTTPAALLAQGHGLLGDLGEGENGYLAALQDQKNYVSITVDLLGMMEDDEKAITYWITNDMSQFRQSVDRQQQGMVNQLLAMRMMMGRMQDEPELKFEGKLTFDRDLRFYRGDSQGGIMGATYMAISPDVTRGYLGEPGQPYNLLLNRSLDFDEFLVVLTPTYGTSRAVQLVLQLLDMVWDRAEPTGYSPYVTSNTLPGLPDAEGHAEPLPAKRILMNVAIGDYQVSPLGAHIMARSMGLKAITPQTRPMFGITEATGPITDGPGGILEFDFGLKIVPKTNVPPRVNDGYPENKDPHDWVRKLAPVFDMTDEFFREGKISNKCEGKCVFPDTEPVLP